MLIFWAYLRRAPLNFSILLSSSLHDDDPVNGCGDDRGVLRLAADLLLPPDPGRGRGRRRGRQQPRETPPAGHAAAAAAAKATAEQHAVVLATL